MTIMKLFEMKKDHTRAYKLASLGVVFLAVGILIWNLDPLQLIVEDKLTMREGSFLCNLFEKPPLEVFISAYVFNITNLHRFLTGQDKKLKLQEVGPYVYQEFLENRNIKFHENRTLSYKPVRYVKFIPEKSVGDPMKDVVTVPNIPYMGVTTAASKMSIFAALAIRALMKSLSSEVVLNVTVQDYFWGYDDPLIDIASTLLPNVVHFHQFGLLDRMFDEGDNLVEMNLPGRKEYLEQEEEQERVAELERKKAEYSSAALEDYSNEIPMFDSLTAEKEKKPVFKPAIRDFSIEMWNGGRGLRYWGYSDHFPQKNTECNTLQGTYDGTLFPRNISKGEVFRIYRKPFCRTLPIVYSHPGSVNGIDAYFFKLAENAFDSNVNDSTSSCFCPDKVCLKRGLGNITPCYYNIPAAASFPHFFNADPSLLDKIEGLNPIEEKHGSEIVLQPQLGVPMKVHSRIQINLLMGDVFANIEMKPFRNMALPIMWMEIAVESLTPGLQILLHLLFNICPYIQTGAIVVLLLAGVSVLATSALNFFCIPKPIKKINAKLQQRHSTVYMFPYIGRELSKIGEEELLASSPKLLA